MLNLDTLLRLGSSAIPCDRGQDLLGLGDLRGHNDLESSDLDEPKDPNDLKEDPNVLRLKVTPDGVRPSRLGKDLWVMSREEWET